MPDGPTPTDDPRAALPEPPRGDVEAAAAAVAQVVARQVADAIRTAVTAAAPAAVPPAAVPSAAAAPAAVPPPGAAPAPAPEEPQDARRPSASTLSPLLVAYGRHLAVFVGAALLAGAIVHFPMAPVRYGVMGVAGALLFAAGSAAESLRAAGTRARVTALASSVAVALGVGMVAGGIQHFEDVPARAAVLIPLGLVVGLAAFAVREGHRLAREHLLPLAAGVLVLAGALGVSLQALAPAAAAGGGHAHAEVAAPAAAEHAEPAHAAPAKAAHAGPAHADDEHEAPSSRYGSTHDEDHAPEEAPAEPAHAPADAGHEDEEPVSRYASPAAEH